MRNFPLTWRTNLRANLVLWPTVAPNIAALAKQDGRIYDEAAFLASFPRSDGEKAPTDARAVRNTIEVLALAGLAFRDQSNPPHFRLTALGRSLFSFLGVTSGTRFATEANRALLADLLIRALAVVAEYRAIWMLMSGTAGVLSNEELNRAIGRIRFLDDIDSTVKSILEARSDGDVARIGPRLYNDADYANEATRLDQRKAMNPLFLLAGGGGIFITLGDELRRLEDWAMPLIDRRLRDTTPLIHASPDPQEVELISGSGAAPFDFWSAQ
jgi:hypothetical protein